jgi:hypothetical protein
MSAKLDEHWSGFGGMWNRIDSIYYSAYIHRLNICQRTMTVKVGIYINYLLIITCQVMP